MEPMTPSEVYEEILQTEFGQVQATAVGFMVGMTDLMSRYESVEDLPEPLRDFVELVTDTVSDWLGE